MAKSRFRRQECAGGGDGPGAGQHVSRRQRQSCLYRYRAGQGTGPDDHQGCQRQRQHARLGGAVHRDSHQPPARTDYTGATFTDSLAGVLDDAAYNNNAAATIGAMAYTSPNLTWTGNLLIGATTTISYSVTVNSPDAGNRTLTSVVTSTTSGNNCLAGSGDTRCSSAVTVLIPALTITYAVDAATTTPRVCRALHRHRDQYRSGRPTPTCRLRSTTPGLSTTRPTTTTARPPRAAWCSVATAVCPGYSSLAPRGKCHRGQRLSLSISPPLATGRCRRQ